MRLEGMNMPGWAYYGKGLQRSDPDVGTHIHDQVSRSQETPEEGLLAIAVLLVVLMVGIHPLLCGHVGRIEAHAKVALLDHNSLAQPAVHQQARYQEPNWLLLVTQHVQ